MTGAALLEAHALPGRSTLCGTPDSLLSTHGLLASPAAWNRLPETVHQAQTQPHFKSLLKTFLIKEFL